MEIVSLIGKAYEIHGIILSESYLDDQRVCDTIEFCTNVNRYRFSFSFDNKLIFNGVKQIDKNIFNNIKVTPIVFLSELTKKEKKYFGIHSDSIDIVAVDLTSDLFSPERKILFGLSMHKNNFKLLINYEKEIFK